MSASTPVPIFYGWKIVAVLFLMLAFSSGFGFYNHAIIIQALSRQSDFPLEVASLAVSFFFLISGISGLLIAPLLERYDVRYVVASGTILMVAGLWLISEVSTVTGLFAAYVVYATGFAGAGLLPATTLVARWFETRRARAMSIASTGLSVGGIMLTPLSAYLVETYTLDPAFKWLAVAYLIIVLPPCLWILRSRPSSIGLQPLGQVSALDGLPQGITFGRAIRQHFFWVLAGSYVLTMAAQVGGITHQYGILIERLTPEQASVGLAILPACSVAGRLAGGVMLEYLPIRLFTIVMMFLQGGSLLVIGFGEELELLYTGLGLFGISVGNLLMLQPLIVAEFYGLGHYARIFSWSNMITVSGVSGGPVLMGWLASMGDGYRLSYLVVGMFALLAGVIFSMGRPPARS